MKLSKNQSVEHIDLVDLDPELLAMFQTHPALRDINDATETRYRLTGLAPVEREHHEVQRSLGMLLQEAARWRPGEWGQCVQIVEWIRYLTPSRSGLCPRDVDRGWSIASPLERELLPLEASPAETVSEVAKTPVSYTHLTLPPKA